MKSLDTNVLLYALNADCAEHVRARGLIESALQEPHGWIIADQVYFELYRLLRNPAVLSAALSAADAARTIAWYRDRSGWLHCAYEPAMMSRIAPAWAAGSFSARQRRYEAMDNRGALSETNRHVNGPAARVAGRAWR